jgi:glycosyltransferase involved in cell wall biosynthesis
MPDIDLQNSPSGHQEPVAQGRILIYVPVPVFGAEGALQIENQACNGLRLWAENFDQVTVMMPHQPGKVPPGWGSASQIGPNLDRIRIVLLPTAWTLPKFLKVYRNTRSVIRDEIGKADYLCFAIGGLIGDWGAVACAQANAMGRSYAVWTDRVESQVTRIEARNDPFKRRIKRKLIWRPMWTLEKWVIRRAALGLFHGQQTFQTYAPYSANPELVHNVHIGLDAHISDREFAAKRASIASDPLRIVYAGRAAAMKAPLDWASALRHLSEAGISFEAHWLGDGPLLEDLRAQLSADGLVECVTLHGFVSDAKQVAVQIQAAHVFLFCHITPESPRCLIEALVKGTPIVGYDGAYAADLISTSGGGYLVPNGDKNKLGRALVRLATNREELAALSERARIAGSPFSDSAVFEHRSNLIKRDLGQKSARSRA